MLDVQLSVCFMPNPHECNLRRRNQPFKSGLVEPGRISSQIDRKLYTPGRRGHDRCRLCSAALSIPPNEGESSMDERRLAATKTFALAREFGQLRQLSSGRFGTQIQVWSCTVSH